MPSESMELFGPGNQPQGQETGKKRSYLTHEERRLIEDATNNLNQLNSPERKPKGLKFLLNDIVKNTLEPLRTLVNNASLEPADKADKQLIAQAKKVLELIEAQIKSHSELIH